MLVETFRAVVGFALVLFIPGYAATWALFPKKKEIDVIERIALSIGLSISLVVLSVFVLNLVFGIKINFVNSLLIILLITLICAGVWYYRQGSDKGGKKSASEKGKSQGKKKGKSKEFCPVCKSNSFTKYDRHYECNACGKQWTQVK